MKKKIIPILILVVAIGFVPFNTTLVPEWKLQVIDENGIPYKEKLVRQFCNNYTLGISPCSGASEALQMTDENGFVLFPERKINMSLLSRIVRPILNFVMLLAHGSYGVEIYVDSSGPQKDETLKYIPGEPLPEKFILPSKSFKITE